jgi:hypothetical protein
MMRSRPTSRDKLVAYAAGERQVRDGRVKRHAPDKEEMRKQGTLARRRSRGPDRMAVYGNCGHPPRIEQHLVTPSGRELIFWEQFANPYERQTPLFRPCELHPAKPHSSVAAGIVGENDLIGRQRHSQAVWKNDERARVPIPDDWELRNNVPFPTEGGMGRELDQQRDVFHVITRPQSPCPLTTLIWRRAVPKDTQGRLSAGHHRRACRP